MGEVTGRLLWDEEVDQYCLEAGPRVARCFAKETASMRRRNHQTRKGIRLEAE